MAFDLLVDDLMMETKKVKVSDEERESFSTQREFLKFSSKLNKVV